MEEANESRGINQESKGIQLQTWSGSISGDRKNKKALAIYRGHRSILISLLSTGVEMCKD